MKAQIDELTWRISVLEEGKPFGPSEPDIGKEPEQPESEEDDEIVYITKGGKKYHREGYVYLTKSATPIKKSDAVKRGFTPCKRCVP
jgi:competence protein ComEC